MKINEIIQTKSSSAIVESKAQDIVAQDIVSSADQSAIAEGIGQILRRTKGKGLKKGFRCIAGPRKGRIVANQDTCSAPLKPKTGAKISQKRLARAKQTAQKRARTIRSGGASTRLKQIQIGKRSKGTANMKKGKKLKKSKPLKKKSKLQRSKIVNPK
jgi:hypothetical protein